VQEGRQNVEVGQLAGRRAGTRSGRSRGERGRGLGLLRGLIGGFDLGVDMAFGAPLAAPDRIGRSFRGFGVDRKVGVRVGRAGSIGQAQPFLAEGIGLAAEGGFDLAPQRPAAAVAHSGPSAGLDLRQPVLVRRIPSGPGGPSTAPGGADRSSSEGRSSNALK
jgi:hypothetical protein